MVLRLDPALAGRLVHYPRWRAAPVLPSVVRKAIARAGRGPAAGRAVHPPGGGQPHPAPAHPPKCSGMTGHDPHSMWPGWSEGQALGKEAPTAVLRPGLVSAPRRPRWPKQPRTAPVLRPLAHERCSARRSFLARWGGGNEVVAVAAMTTFLALNGWQADLDPAGAFPRPCSPAWPAARLSWVLSSRGCADHVFPSSAGPAGEGADQGGTNPRMEDRASGGPPGGGAVPAVHPGGPGGGHPQPAGSQAAADVGPPSTFSSL